MQCLPTLRRHGRLCLLCASLLTLVACSSAPPRYYTLTAQTPQTPRAASSSAAASAAPLAIAVGPVSLPALVDRPQIVVTRGDNEVRLDEYRRWASPLQDNLARVVADELSTRLATPRVAVLAHYGAADAHYRVAIDVHRFVSQPGQSALIDATWSVLRVRDNASRGGRSTARVAIADAGYDALASAHSQALTELSAAIAAAIGELEHPEY